MNVQRDPMALEQSITDRIARLALARSVTPSDRGMWIQRMRRELAYRRLLARLFDAQPEEWVLKGGVSLQFRLDPNRPSNDIDIAYLDHGADHAVALRRLRLAANGTLDDGFTFEIGEPITSIDELRAITVLVTARIGVREFASFHVDMAPPRSDIPYELIQPDGPDLGIEVLDRMPMLRLIALEQQVADKVCAMFELHGESQRPSARSRDLGDLALLAAQCEFDGATLTTAIRAEEARRRSELLAHGLPQRIELAGEQQREWPRTWRRQARDPQFDFDESLAITARFIDPVLAGMADGRRWTFEQGWHDG